MRMCKFGVPGGSPTDTQPRLGRFFGPFEGLPDRRICSRASLVGISTFRWGGGGSFCFPFVREMCRIRSVLSSSMQQRGGGHGRKRPREGWDRGLPGRLLSGFFGRKFTSSFREARGGVRGAGHFRSEAQDGAGRGPQWRAGPGGGGRGTRVGADEDREGIDPAFGLDMGRGGLIKLSRQLNRAVRCPAGA